MSRRIDQGDETESAHSGVVMQALLLCGDGESGLDRPAHAR